jgi:hypothetical protein
LFVPPFFRHANGGSKKKEKVKAFFYAHSVTDADSEHILGLEKVVFSIEAKFCQDAKDSVRLFV